MARPMGDEKKRQKTKESLTESIEKSGLLEKFYVDKIDEYMSFYDDLFTINEQLTSMKSKNGSDFSLKAYTDATAEKRRISSEMRSILSYLGLKPMAVTSGGGGKYEEL